MLNTVIKKVKQWSKVTIKRIFKSRLCRHKWAVDVHEYMGSRRHNYIPAWIGTLLVTLCWVEFTAVTMSDKVLLTDTKYISKIWDVGDTMTPTGRVGDGFVFVQTCNIKGTGVSMARKNYLIGTVGVTKSRTIGSTVPPAHFQYLNVPSILSWVTKNVSLFLWVT
jgi:hypothetical protein